MPWSPASDHAADTLLKRLGELLGSSGPQADKATDADHADEVRAEMKRLGIELMRDAISDNADGANSSYLHPKALLKLIRVSRCATTSLSPPTRPHSTHGRARAALHAIAIA
jgi:hypothetical protein